MREGRVPGSGRIPRCGHAHADRQRRVAGCKRKAVGQRCRIERDTRMMRIAFIRFRLHIRCKRILQAGMPDAMLQSGPLRKCHNDCQHEGDRQTNRLRGELRGLHQWRSCEFRKSGVMPDENSFLLLCRCLFDIANQAARQRPTLSRQGSMRYDRRTKDRQKIEMRHQFATRLHSTGTMLEWQYDARLYLFVMCPAGKAQRESVSWLFCGKVKLSAFLFPVARKRNGSKNEREISRRTVFV